MSRLALVFVGVLIAVPLAELQLLTQFNGQNFNPVGMDAPLSAQQQPPAQLGGAPIGGNRLPGLQRPRRCRISAPGCGLRSNTRPWVFDDTLSYAKRGDIPWQVKLLVRSSGAKWYCSGTVLNNEWIVAQAYCLYFKTPGDITSDRVKVIFGELNPFSTNLTKNVNYFSVSELKFHPTADLAVVRTSRSLPPAANSLCLPGNDRSDHGLGKVSGWPQYVLNYLVSASARSHPYDHCTGLGNDDRSLMCVVSQGPPDCGMDAGSPFYRQASNRGPMVLVGIKLKDEKCRVSDSELSTERYLRISAFVPWITDAIGVCSTRNGPSDDDEDDDDDNETR